MKSQTSIGFLVLVFVTLGFVANSTTFAQKARVKAKVGDRVQVTWFGEWCNGEVLEILSKGTRAKVKIIDGKGKGRTWTYYAKDIRYAKPKPKKADAKLRKWTSANGKFSIKATYVGEEGGKVKLEKQDGSVIAVALDSLSEKDNAYVKQRQEMIAAVNPFENAEEVDEGSADKSTAAEPEVVKSQNPRYPYSTYDASEAKPMDTASKTAFKARAEMAIEPISKESIPIHGLTGRGQVNNFVFNRDNSMAVVSFSKGFAGKDGVDVGLIDVGQSKAIANVSIPMPKNAVVDISSDGKLLASQSMTFAEQPRVDVWKLVEGKIEHHVGWQLPKKDGTPGAWPKFTAFTADDRILTISGTGQIAIWEIDPLKPIAYANKGEHYSSFSNNCYSISHDRKTLYFFERPKMLGDGSLVGLDLQTLKPIGRSEVEDLYTAAVAVSRSGNKVALLGNKMIKVFDGELKLLDEFTTTFNSFFVGIRWIDERYLICFRGGNVTLIDTETRVPLWKYNFSNWFNASFLAMDAAGNVWEGNGRQVHRVAIPHPAAQAAIPDDAESQLVFRPGKTIYLDLRMGGGGPAVKMVRDNYTKQFTALGLKVVTDPGADLVLIASASGGKAETTTYQVLGGGIGSPSTETVTTRTIGMSVEVLEKGQVVWSVAGASGTSAPSFLMLEAGESAQSAINKMGGQGKVQVGFFAGLKFIKNIVRHPHGGALGQSDVKNGSIKEKPFPPPKKRGNGIGGLRK